MWCTSLVRGPLDGRLSACCGGPCRLAAPQTRHAAGIAIGRAWEGGVRSAEPLPHQRPLESPPSSLLLWLAVGGDMFDICVDALAPRGRLIIIGAMSQVQHAGAARAHGRHYSQVADRPLLWLVCSSVRKRARSARPAASHAALSGSASVAEQSPHIRPMLSYCAVRGRLGGAAVPRHRGEAALEVGHAAGLLPAALRPRLGAPPGQAGGAGGGGQAAGGGAQCLHLSRVCEAGPRRWLAGAARDEQVQPGLH